LQYSAIVTPFEQDKHLAVIALQHNKGSFSTFCGQQTAHLSAGWISHSDPDGHSPLVPRPQLTPYSSPPHGYFCLLTITFISFSNTFIS